MIIYDNEFLKVATALIHNAYKRIDIATFKAEITHRPRGKDLLEFFETLYRKKRQGLEINFLFNWNTKRRAVPASNRFAVKELLREKINVRTLPGNRCCHAKIIIVDQTEAIIGSHNLSVRSCRSNFEVSYLITLPEDLARLQAIYNHALDTSQPPL